MRHVYVRAWALVCFYSLISTQTFRRALTASVDSYAEIKIECPFSGVTKSGRVWRKVPESDADAGKQFLGCGSFRILSWWPGPQDLQC